MSPSALKKFRKIYVKYLRFRPDRSEAKNVLWIRTSHTFTTFIWGPVRFRKTFFSIFFRLFRPDIAVSGCRCGRDVYMMAKHRGPEQNERSTALKTKVFFFVIHCSHKQ